MKIPELQSTLKLHHFGRRSGKEFEVTIWFTKVDGELWIGSLDQDRSWVRNLRGSGRGKVDFGGGALEVTAREKTDPADKERHREAVRAKYPVLSRVIALLVRGKTPAVFRLEFAAQEQG